MADIIEELKTPGEYNFGKDDNSALRIKRSGGVTGIRLVATDSSAATPYRVMTSEGVMAWGIDEDFDSNYIVPDAGIGFGYAVVYDSEGNYYKFDTSERSDYATELAALKETGTGYWINGDKCYEKGGIVTFTMWGDGVPPWDTENYLPIYEYGYPSGAVLQIFYVGPILANYTAHGLHFNGDYGYISGSSGTIKFSLVDFVTKYRRNDLGGQQAFTSSEIAATGITNGVIAVNSDYVYNGNYLLDLDLSLVASVSLSAEKLYYTQIPVIRTLLY